jgi:hypothetical protein
LATATSIWTDILRIAAGPVPWRLAPVSRDVVVPSLPYLAMTQDPDRALPAWPDPPLYRWNASLALYAEPVLDQEGIIALPYGDTWPINA